MKQKRVAEIIIETLVAAGVKRIYGVVAVLNGGGGDEVIDLAVSNVIR
jgi:hypothetical protein